MVDEWVWMSFPQVLGAGPEPRVGEAPRADEADATNAIFTTVDAALTTQPTHYCFHAGSNAVPVHRQSSTAT